MKKLDSARFMKNAYKAMRRKINSEILKALQDADDHKIELQDVRGSLVVGGDDQESECIMSVELHRPDPIDQSKDSITVWVGVYEEDNAWGIDELTMEQLLNVLEAVEEAVNNPE